MLKLFSSTYYLEIMGHSYRKVKVIKVKIENALYFVIIVINNKNVPCNRINPKYNRKRIYIERTDSRIN